MCIRDSITLTYYNSNTHRIANIFRKHNYKMAYRTNNTIKRRINGTNKDIDIYNKTGVYKLNCNDCNKFYIGQTGRSFSSIFSEHTKALSNNNIKSTFATHIQTENHSYTCLLYTSRCV